MKKRESGEMEAEEKRGEKEGEKEKEEEGRGSKENGGGR